MLAAETIAMTNLNTMKQNSVGITLGALTGMHGRFSKEHNANLSRTIGEELNNTDRQRRINDNSAMDQYRSIKSPMDADVKT